MPVKATPSNSAAAAAASTTPSTSASAAAAAAPAPAKAKEKGGRGQNKKRKSESLGYAAGADEGAQLCRAIMQGRPCRFGDRCRDVHDVASYLASKPADLGPLCHVWSVRGECPAGIACRFGASHTDTATGLQRVKPGPAGGGGGGTSLASEGASAVASAEAADAGAGASVAATTAAGGNTDDAAASSSCADGGAARAAAPSPSPSPAAAQGASAASSGAGHHVAPEEHNQLPYAVMPLLSKRKYVYKRAVVVGRPQQQAGEGGAGGGRSAAAALLPTSFHPREAAAASARLDFRDSIYVGPLTTVGNLPWRRILVEQGADVTCGEMALCPELVTGSPSEWALLRRHTSERRFGVQVAGSHADVVSQAVELISDTCDRVDFIDLNMGCPLDAVCGRGMGAALLGKPARLREILRAARGATSLPLTLKMRTGLDLDVGARFAHKLVGRVRLWSLAEHMAAAGAGGADAAGGGDPVAPLVSAITLHGRTRQQRYSKTADWEYIAAAAAAGVGPLCTKAAFAAGDLGWPAAGMQARIDGLLAARGVAGVSAASAPAALGGAGVSFFSGGGGGGGGDTTGDGEEVVTLPIHLAPEIPLLGNGDILSWQEYHAHLAGSGTAANMLARGALIKPWLPREIKERLDLDVSASERLEFFRQFVNYG